MNSWESDPYWSDQLEPGWTISRDGDFAADRHPPVARIQSKIESKELGLAREFVPIAAPEPRLHREAKPAPEQGPPTGRVAAKAAGVFGASLPYHQRVRAEDIERLGLNGDV